MTNFTISSFNTKNLIGADSEYYQFEKYTPEEYAWKEAWLAKQVVAMNADIVGLQEVFEETALASMMTAADMIGNASNRDAIPDRSRDYANKKIFQKLAYQDYGQADVVFAPNLFDGEPGHRRPGIAVVSRFGFVGKPVIVQQLDPPLEIAFPHIGGGDAGTYRLDRLSRPAVQVQVPVGDQVVTVINCHLKSKLGEFIRPAGEPFAPEANLTDYHPLGRSLGSLRSALRRMAEAFVIRRMIVDVLRTGSPLIVLGDFNDGEHAVSSEIIAGERPFKNYSWMRRHDATHPHDRYSAKENNAITSDVERHRLMSAEKLFVRQSLRDMVFTSAFGGVYESVDQIFLSRDFNPDNPKATGGMSYFSVFNDHLTDGLHPEAPYNKLASDHGQIMAHLWVGG